MRLGNSIRANKISRFALKPLMGGTYGVYDRSQDRVIAECKTLGDGKDMTILLNRGEKIHE